MRILILCLLVLLGVPTVSFANQYYGDGVTNPIWEVVGGVISTGTVLQN